MARNLQPQQSKYHTKVAKAFDGNVLSATTTNNNIKQQNQSGQPTITHELPHLTLHYDPHQKKLPLLHLKYLRNTVFRGLLFQTHSILMLLLPGDGQQFLYFLCWLRGLAWAWHPRHRSSVVKQLLFPWWCGVV